MTYMWVPSKVVSDLHDVDNDQRSSLGALEKHALQCITDVIGLYGLADRLGGLVGLQTVQVVVEFL